jgi:hypothetical protein
MLLILYLLQYALFTFIVRRKTKIEKESRILFIVKNVFYFQELTENKNRIFYCLFQIKGAIITEDSYNFSM